MNISTEGLKRAENKALSVAIMKNLIFQICKQGLYERKESHKIQKIKQVIGKTNPGFFEIENASLSKERLSRIASSKSTYFLQKV